MKSLQKIYDLNAKIEELSKQREDEKRKLSKKLFGNGYKMEKVLVQITSKATKNVYIPIFKAPKGYVRVTEKIEQGDCGGKLEYSYTLKRSSTEESFKIIIVFYYYNEIYCFYGSNLKFKDANIAWSIRSCSVSLDGKDDIFLSLNIDKEDIIKSIAIDEGILMPKKSIMEEFKKVRDEFSRYMNSFVFTESLEIKKIKTGTYNDLSRNFDFKFEVKKSRIDYPDVFFENNQLVAKFSLVEMRQTKVSVQVFSKIGLQISTAEFTYLDWADLRFKDPENGITYEEVKKSFNMYCK